MAKFLVLGSTGVVGSRVAAQLVREGHQVRGATRAVGEHRVEGVESVRLDLFEPDTFVAALEGVEGVFALSPSGYADAYGALAPFLSQAVKTSTVKRVVLMTAQGVDFSDEIPLRRLEILLESADVESAFVRPNWFMQNFQTYWAGMLQNNILHLPAAQGKVAFVDAGDIAKSAVALLLTKDQALLGRGWEITGPEALTHEEALSVLNEKTGRSAVYTSISDEDAMSNFVQAGMPQDYAGLLVMLFQGLRQGAASQVTQSVKVLTQGEPVSLSQYAQENASSL